MKLTRSQIRDLAIDSVVLIDGVKHWVALCARCGGSGRYSRCETYQDHCFWCGTPAEIGHGKSFLRTSPEQRAKAAARRAAKAEKAEAARRAQAEAEAAERAAKAQKAAEEAARKAAEEAARKAKSQHVGAVGERVELELTYEFAASWDSQWGTQYLRAFRDTDGNRLVWKTSASLGYNTTDGRWVAVAKGERCRVKATIKDHSEYRGEAQTVLTRAKVLGQIA